MVGYIVENKKIFFVNRVQNMKNRRFRRMEEVKLAEFKNA